MFEQLLAVFDPPQHLVTILVHLPLEVDHVVRHPSFIFFKSVPLHLKLLLDETIDAFFELLKIFRLLFFAHHSLHLLFEFVQALFCLDFKLAILIADCRYDLEFLDHLFDTLLQYVTILSVKLLVKEVRVVKFECMWTLAKIIWNSL